MAAYLVYAVLVCMGMLIGGKKRENLIYLLFFLFPFQEIGIIKYLNIESFQVMIYLCIVPMTLLIFFDAATSWNNRFGFLKGIPLILLAFFAYLVFRYFPSVHPQKDYFIKLLAVGFLIMIYTLLHFQSIDMLIIIRITSVMIVFQFLIAALQTFFGLSLGDIFKFIDASGVNAALIEMQSFKRAVGTFGDPNYYALYITVMTASLVNHLHKLNMKIVYGCGVLAIIFSFSRMGIIACVILLVFYIYKSTKWYLPRSVGRLFIYAAVILAASLFILESYENIPILSAIVERFTYNNGNIGDAAGTRDFILKTFFNQILTSFSVKDILLGLGIQNFEFALYSQTSIYLVAHNEYIQIFSDIGLVGCLFILSIPVYISMRYRNHNLFRRNPQNSSLIVILYGCIFLMCTYELYLYFYLAVFLGYGIFSGKPEVLPEYQEPAGEQFVVKSLDLEA